MTTNILSKSLVEMLQHDLHHRHESIQKRGKLQQIYMAAGTALRIIEKLEPQLRYGEGSLSLLRDDVASNCSSRSVVCCRNQWKIEILCCRDRLTINQFTLSDSIDFGKEWFGIPCSAHYFDVVGPIFNELRVMRNNAVKNHASLPLWNDITDKAEKYYVPVLNAFLEELRRLANEHPEIPGRLIHYMLGRYDFYKVITDDSHETTRVEAINIAGTLNRAADGHRSIVSVPKLKLPSRFFHMGFVPGFDNKIEVVCDEGWALTMRIHNASSKVEPSLKFDVQLTSLPTAVHVQIEPW